MSETENTGVTESGDARSADLEEKLIDKKLPLHVHEDPMNNAGGDTRESIDDDSIEEKTTDNIPDITIDDEGNYYIVSSDDEDATKEIKSTNKDSVTLDNVTNGFESRPQPSNQTDDTAEVRQFKNETETETTNVQITETESGGNKVNINSAENSEANDVSLDSENKNSLGQVVSESRDQKSEESKEKEETKTDEPLDILGNGLLVKKVITPAEDPRIRPTYGDIATLRSEGVLENGSVIDKHESIKFTVGDGDVIQAWDLCTALMGVGEVCELKTDAKYAYGGLGSPPSVPANAKITYTLELLKKQPGLDLSKLSVEERLKFGDEKRERGNYLFGRTDFSGAINSYSKALKILDDENSSHSEDVRLLQNLLDTRMKCYNNIAAAQLKVEAYDAAIKSCDEVLKVQPENVKALFRKGKAHAGKGNTELAITVLKKAVQLDPESKIVQQELFRQTKKLKKETESEKEMYMKMFGSTKSPATEKKKSSSQWKTWGLMAIGGTSAVLLSLAIAAYRNMKN